MSEFFVGVDGGGSHSSITIIDSRGNHLITLEGGNSNKNYCGIETASKNITDTIDKALQKLHIKKSKINGICLALAGCDTLNDKILWNNEMKKYFKDERVLIHVFNDTVGSLASVDYENMNGIVVISGTGSIVCGYKGDPEKKTKIGGWGPLLGDDSNGYWIGMEVLKHCGHEVDNGIISDLTLDIMKHYKITKFSDIIDVLYNDKNKMGGSQTYRVAHVTKLVFNYYNKLDSVTNIINKCCYNLCNQVSLCVSQMYTEEELDNKKLVINIICAGSLLCKSDRFRTLFKDKLNGLLGDYIIAKLRVVVPENSPQFGAALYIRNQVLKTRKSKL